MFIICMICRLECYFLLSVTGSVHEAGGGGGGADYNYSIRSTWVFLTVSCNGKHDIFVL